MKITILNLIIVFVILSSTVVGQMAPPKDHFSKYMFDDIQIEGKTNVNDFHLKYRENKFYTLPDGMETGSSTLGITIPANQVQADSKAMLNDFLALIHANKYPTINIKINQRDIRSSISKVSSTKDIEVSMNGVTKKFECKTYSEPCSNDQRCLIGELKVRLTDFGIEPPRKFFGLVKVKDEIFINFRVLFS